MLWANFLHIYQPPNQKPSILEKIVNECYRPLLTTLVENPTAKVTLNINGVLSDMLAANNHHDVLDLIKTLSEKGQVELTASAKYHPFLPTLETEEVIRQIKLNNETNRHFFGESYQPKGFFIPEMAYTKELGKLILDQGYQWTIVDQLSLPQDYDTTKLYQTPDGLTLYFRDYATSIAIIQADHSRELIASHFSDETPDRYCVSAMDGEIFGHHKPNHIPLLVDLYNSPAITSVTLSELGEKISARTTIEPKASSWDAIDRSRPEPFTRWNDPTNEIHAEQAKLQQLAIKSVKHEVAQFGDTALARQLLDAGLHSCQLWWASATPWWSLEMVEQGAHQLLSAVEACRSASAEVKQEAKEIYYAIITKGFDWQRTGHVDERGRS
jgi:predicted glycosyl hydrolase (DUF1957 family)